MWEREYVRDCRGVICREEEGRQWAQNNQIKVTARRHVSGDTRRSARSQKGSDEIGDD